MLVCSLTKVYKLVDFVFFMEILLIRHGESEGNKSVKVQDKHEPLSEAGLVQAKGLASKLKREKFNVVFSSDMKRASHTATILFSKHRCPIMHLKELREKRNGDFEGKHQSEVDWAEINKIPFLKRKAPNGESLLDVKKRAKEFLDFLELLACKKVAVVSHGTFLRVLIAIVSNRPIKEVIFGLKMKNCAVVRLKYTKGKFSVTTIDE